jgi:hypothetical protein
MKSKLKTMELVGFTIWICLSLIFTVILCQFIVPANLQANNLLKELVDFRGFPKRFLAVFISIVVLLPISVGCYMWVIETDPSDFRNFQGRPYVKP